MQPGEHHLGSGSLCGAQAEVTADARQPQRGRRTGEERRSALFSVDAGGVRGVKELTGPQAGESRRGVPWGAVGERRRA